MVRVCTYRADNVTTHLTTTIGALMFGMMAGAESPHSLKLDVSPLVWALSIAAIVAIIVIDLMIDKRHPALSKGAAAKVTGVFAGLGLLAGVAIWAMFGGSAASAYYGTWLIEWSLSFDNLFVMGTIFMFFKVPPKYQSRLLYWGVMGAMVFRFAFIMVGAELLERFALVSVIMGLFLIYTGWGLVTSDDEDTDIRESRIYRMATRLLPLTWERGHGDSFRVTVIENGRRVQRFTYLVLCIIVIELFDVMFAVDSVPAALAQTSDRYIVFMGMTFSMLGLRKLYMLLEAMKEDEQYKQYLSHLNEGLGLLLSLIGIKMILQSDVSIFGWFNLPGLHLPTWASLSLIIGILIGSVVWGAVSPAPTLSDESVENIIHPHHRHQLVAPMEGVTAVTLLVPDDTVSSLHDEVADGSVNLAVEAVKARLMTVDDDGVIPRVAYGQDLLGAVQRMLEVAAENPNGDLFAVVTDGVVSDRDEVVRLLMQLGPSDRVVMIRVDNQGAEDPDRSDWLLWLDEDSPVATIVSVKTLGEFEGHLGLDELRGWYAKLS